MLETLYMETIEQLNAVLIEAIEERQERIPKEARLEIYKANQLKVREEE